MRRSTLMAVLMLALLIAPFWLLPGGSPGLTKANFDRITKDMTREEVDALLGEGKGTVCVGTGGGGTLLSQFEGICYLQEDRTGLIPANRIEVRFLNDRVESKTFHPWTFAEWWQQIRGRLGL